MHQQFINEAIAALPSDVAEIFDQLNMVEKEVFLAISPWSRTRHRPRDYARAFGTQHDKRGSASKGTRYYVVQLSNGRWARILNTPDSRGCWLQLTQRRARTPQPISTTWITSEHEDPLTHRG